LWWGEGIQKVVSCQGEATQEAQFKQKKGVKNQMEIISCLGGGQKPYVPRETLLKG